MRRTGVFLIGVLLLSTLLTWASIGRWDARVGLSFALTVGMAGLGLVAVGRALPRKVFALLLGAALLRLGVGVFWTQALPRWGYGTEVEQAGYVMADAHDRDLAAWRLARSETPLWAAFRGYHHSDQYGGMLFLSAAVYRYLDRSDRHLPLLMVVIAAAASALAVPLVWAAARVWWDDAVARWAAWGMALYPEAVLLGSTQMREAFTVPLAAAALLALAGWERAGSRRAALAMAGVLAGLAFFSPPIAVLTAAMLTLVWGMGRRRWSRRQMVWGGLALGLLAALGWLLAAWFLPDRGGVLASIRWWLGEVFRYQSYLVERASGWMQKIFRATPEAFHLPFLMTYGLLQPLLPAALVASGAPLWRGIAVWRALGWTLLLAGLIYVPAGARRSRGQRALLWGLWLAVLLGMLVADYRGAADQWDNPRYRATWAAWQIALVAWAWESHRRAPDPWLRRLAGALASAMIWFLFWYLRRYTPFPWPVVDVFRTAGLGLLTALLFLLWDWARDPP